MAKTNFTKVEEALIEGLRKLEIAKLNEEAIRASNPLSPIDEATQNTQSKLVAYLKTELRLIAKRDPHFYENLGMTQESIQKALEVSLPLSTENWELLTSIKDKIKLRKEEQERSHPQQNDTLIEAERKKHINKRFNIRDKWLPLT